MNCFDLILQKITRWQRRPQVQHKIVGNQENNNLDETSRHEQENDTSNNNNNNSVVVEAPDDWEACVTIEKVASVVAWMPSAELFLRKNMQGSEEFEFMSPDSEHYAYYRRRVLVNRMRQCPLYASYQI